MHRLLLPISVAALSITSAFAHGQNVPYSNVSAQAFHIIEPAHALTLQAALDLALKANAALQAAGIEVDAAEGAQVQAAVRPNPVVSVLLEDQRGSTRTSTYQLSQAIELGGKRAARIGAAQRGRDLALADWNARQADLRSQVITAFFDVLIQQERLRLAQASVELARGGTNVAAKRVTAGKISPVEETKARVAEASVRLDFNSGKSELVSARKRLAATWGNSAPVFERADGQLEQLPELPAGGDLTRRVTNAPMLKRARVEVERRQALTRLERSRRMPDATLSVGLKRSEQDGRNQAIAGLSIALPFFDRNQGNVVEAQRRTDKARAELAATEIRLDNELAQACERLRNARQELDALNKEIMPGAQSAYDAAAKGFEFGKFSFLEVLDAQRTLLQAKSQYLRALSEAHRSAAEIDRLLGPLPPAPQANISSPS